MCLAIKKVIERRKRMIYGFNSFGYEGSLVGVETEVEGGIPAYDIAGLADSYGSGTRELVESAVERSGFEIPQRNILTAFSPLDLKKDGGGFAFPAALSLVAKSVADVLVMGVLETDGDIIPCIKGTFSACQNAGNNGIKYAILPLDSKVPCGIKVCEVGSLKEAADAITSLNIGDDRLFTERGPGRFSTKDNILFNDDIPELKPEFDGTENNSLKFAMTAAIAGGHHLVAYGKPRYSNLITVGLRLLLPRLSFDESMVTSRIHSIAGIYEPDNYVTERPVRIPHKSISIEGMFGGGIGCTPGEISLAHNGVLFLDEAEEFRTSVLQVLRVPLSAGKITLSRAGRQTVYPSKFQLFMAANPCPCGNFGSKEKLCLCSKTAIETFRKKLAFPLNDRLAVRINTNSDDAQCKDFTLEELRKFISTAWKHQLDRQGKLNQDLSVDEAFDLKISDEAKAFLDEATEDFSVGRKAEILKLARTLCDISDGSDEIKEEHIEEAVKLNGKSPAEI